MNSHANVHRTSFERVHGGIDYGDRKSQGEEMLEQLGINYLAIGNMFSRRSREEHLITFKSSVKG